MARRNIYLGRRVKDRGKRGLDTLSEVRDIAREILRDYKSHRISYRTAMSRLNLLELIVCRDSDFRGRKRAKARQIVDSYREKLMRRRRGR